MTTEVEGQGAMPVSAFVADAVASIAPNANLLEVADALHDSDVGALVVGGGDDVVGIVSERDFVTALAQRRAREATPVRDVATTELVWCDATATATATVAEVAEEWQHAVWVGLLMAAVVLPLQADARAADWPWQTMVFTTLAFLQLGHGLAVRSERRSLFQLGHRSNPWMTRAALASATAQLATVYVPALHDPFGTESLTAVQLAVVVVASTAAFVAVEIEKALRRRREP